MFFNLSDLKVIFKCIFFWTGKKPSTSSVRSCFFIDFYLIFCTLTLSIRSCNGPCFWCFFLDIARKGTSRIYSIELYNRNVCPDTKRELLRLLFLLCIEVRPRPAISRTIWKYILHSMSRHETFKPRSVSKMKKFQTDKTHYAARETFFNVIQKENQVSRRKWRKFFCCQVFNVGQQIQPSRNQLVVIWYGRHSLKKMFQS